MPILDCSRGAVFENAINDHRLKSTESTVYLNNQVVNGLFTLINGAFVENAAPAVVKSFQNTPVYLDIFCILIT